MRGMVPPDPQSSASNLEYAVVYVPKRSRNRFSLPTISELRYRPAYQLTAVD